MEQQRSEMQTSSVSESSGTGKVFVFNCPYLGTLEDVDTSLAYPAPANHCFRMNSPSAVELTHQEAYCLTDQHPGCHVFQMANAGSANEEAAAMATAPEKRKRRAGLYAFPLILILILLAAIIWWPAPGTTVQQSLVRGAQNNRAVSGGVTLNGKLDTQRSEVEEAAVAEAATPDAGETSAGGAALNGSDDPSSDTSGAGASSAAESSDNSSNAESQTVLETEAATAPEQAAEPAAAGESSTEAAAEAEQTAVDPPVVENEASNEEPVLEAAAQETAEATDSVEAGEEATADAASEETAAETVSEVVTEADEDSSEADEAAAVITADLPVLSADIAAVSSAPAERDNTDSTGGVVTMVGPVAGTVLSLRDDPEDVRSLAVYQGPAKESSLLSHIESRQFVTLLGRDRSGAWLNIQLSDGVQGWINTEQKEAGVDMSTLPFGEDGTIAEVVSAQAAEPAATSYPVIRSAYVNTGALNVRSGPGVGYDPITIVNSGELVGLIGRRGLGPWVRVRLDSGLEGWVNSSLLAPVS